MPKATEKVFTQISGIPIHYARLTHADYGTRGNPNNFYCTNEFYAKLEVCFDELVNRCPLGQPSVITCAGTFVDKSRSLHNQGRAFDLDAIFWDNKKELVTKNFIHDAKFYLAIEAIIRKHFGTALSYYYDLRHRDHIHFDDGTRVDYARDKQSYVFFVQAVLSHIFSKDILIDGIHGPITGSIIREVFRENGINGDITTINVWKSFLDLIIDKGFEDSVPVENPLTLLRDVYDIINNAPIDQIEAKKIETALTNFANYQETMEWLNQYRV